jgi:hypothetical protein
VVARLELGVLIGHSKRPTRSSNSVRFRHWLLGLQTKKRGKMEWALSFLNEQVISCVYQRSLAYLAIV